MSNKQLDSFFLAVILPCFSFEIEAVYVHQDYNVKRKLVVDVEVFFFFCPRSLFILQVL